MIVCVVHRLDQEGARQHHHRLTAVWIRALSRGVILGGGGQQGLARFATAFQEPLETRPTLRPELRRIFDEHWEADEPAYRYLAGEK